MSAPRTDSECDRLDLSARHQPLCGKFHGRSALVCPGGPLPALGRRSSWPLCQRRRSPSETDGSRRGSRDDRRSCVCGRACGRSPRGTVASMVADRVSSPVGSTRNHHLCLRPSPRQNGSWTKWPRHPATGSLQLDTNNSMVRPSDSADPVGNSGPVAILLPSGRQQPIQRTRSLHHTPTALSQAGPSVHIGRDWTPCRTGLCLSCP